MNLKPCHKGKLKILTSPFLGTNDVYCSCGNLLWATPTKKRVAFFPNIKIKYQKITVVMSI